MASPNLTGFRTWGVTTPPETCQISLFDVVVSSSRPSFPLKTRPVRPLAANSLAISGAIEIFATPKEVAIGCTGLAKGPRKLKVVGIAKSLRIGATNLIAGWKTGAKKKVIPAFSNTEATCSAERSRRMPSFSSISEEPVLPEADRLPCFRTGIPVAATKTEAMLDMFTVPSKSPPVPTISTASFPVSSLSELVSMASTKPESSTTLSPLRRNPTKNASINPGSVWPVMISSSAQAASPLVRSLFSISLDNTEDQEIEEDISESLATFLILISLSQMMLKQSKNHRKVPQKCRIYWVRGVRIES